MNQTIQTNNQIAIIHGTGLHHSIRNSTNNSTLNSLDTFENLLTNQLTKLLSNQQIKTLVTDQDALYRTALHNFQNDQFQVAEEAFLKLCYFYPNNPLYGIYMGAIWFQMGRYQKALELFCHLATYASATETSLQWCAVCLQHLNRHEEAQACLDLAQQVLKTINF